MVTGFEVATRTAVHQSQQGSHIFFPVMSRNWYDLWSHRWQRVLLTADQGWRWQRLLVRWRGLDVAWISWERDGWMYTVRSIIIQMMGWHISLVCLLRWIRWGYQRVLMDRIGGIEVATSIPVFLGRCWCGCNVGNNRRCHIRIRIRCCL